MDRTWRAAAAAGGAGMVVLILLSSSLASAGIAHPRSFPGATWTPNGSRYFSGCATSKMTNPSWSATSGIGRWAGTAFASTCGTARGGPSVFSYSSASGGYSVNAPVTLASGAGGVNVTWALKLSAWDTAGAAATAGCPSTTIASNTNYGYTWYNYTYTYADCYAIASVGAYAYAYLVDLTNGTYYFANTTWAGLSNISGIESYSFSDTYTYSNSSYWIYNGSYSSNSSYSYGVRGSITGSYAPQALITGTFNASHTYVVYASVSASVYAEVAGYSSGHARAYYNAQTNGHHESIKSIVVW
ncbi:MAG: hypothetical protein L3K08_06940 [Thermoplasmata archaeon]|nr:hypothetical protein [Thermoplasmata archaeon]